MPLTDPTLRRARAVGLVLIAAQLVFFCGWTVVEWGRYGLTWDFSIYNQAWWLIAHGHLNPYDTTLGFPFWQNHAEFFMWPLALLYYVYPHGITLLLVQDLAVVAAEAVALVWICERIQARRVPDQHVPPWLVAAAGIAFLICNPWTLWSCAFDFHAEAIVGVFVVLAARDFSYRRRRAWLWVVICLSFGDVSATYLVGIGISLLLIGLFWHKAADRYWRRTAVSLIALGVVYLAFISLIGGNKGSGLAGGYSYLATSTGQPAHLSTFHLILGVLEHPWRVVSVLWDRRIDIYSNIAPSGLIGFLSPWGFGVPLVIIAEDSLHQYLVFANPGFQSMTLYLFIAVGSVDVILRLSRWRRVPVSPAPTAADPAAAVPGEGGNGQGSTGALARVRDARWNPWIGWALVAMTVLLIANSTLWAATWIPAAPSHWLNVSTPSAQVLDKAAAMMAPSDEVIVSQGISGRFSDRTQCYPIVSESSFPIEARTVWFVVSPYQGTETVPVAWQLGLIGELADQAHARLVLQGSGVWVFEYHPAATVKTFNTSANPQVLPAWATEATAGRPDLTGPSTSWQMVSNGRTGYVVYGDYWGLASGDYQVTVRMWATAAVNVEVWNASASVLVLQRTPPATAPGTFEDVKATFVSGPSVPHSVFNGQSLWRITPYPPSPLNEFEVRVWSPGGVNVHVSTISIRPVASP